MILFPRTCMNTTTWESVKVPQTFKYERLMYINEIVSSQPQFDTGIDARNWSQPDASKLPLLSSIGQGMIALSMLDNELLALSRGLTIG